MKTRWSLGLSALAALACSCSEDHAKKPAPMPAPGGGAGLPTPAVTYDQAQADLEKARSAGPMTSSGSTVACTANQLVWRDEGTDGAVHSWDARTKMQTDYAFKAPHAALFVPSDSYIVVGGEVGSPSSGKILAYRTGEPNTLVATLPDAVGFAAADGAIIRADQTIGDTKLDGTKARRWSETPEQTVDISNVLPTQLPPVAFANDQLVLQGSRIAPSPLYVVDVKNSTTATVTFDSAMVARQMLPSSEGLLVSYVRKNDDIALRLYRGDHDSPDDRVELGDELANHPALLADAPTDEHRFYRGIAMHGRTLLYASKFGIFAYDFAVDSLTPVQVSAGKKTFVPDVLCVITEQNLLVYREMDSDGGTWTVPLVAPPP